MDDDLPKGIMNHDSIILSIINAGYNGHMGRMLQYMEKYIKQCTDKTDPYYIQFKHNIDTCEDFIFLANRFNKKHQGIASIDTYHQALYMCDSGIVDELNIHNYDKVSKFIEACEKYLLEHPEVEDDN